MSKPRGRVSIFSEKSRARLRIVANEIIWPRRRLGFQTVTYPRAFAHDPRSWKRDLDTWRRAFARQWGPPLAVWAMEFQRRGAPHFHLALVLPATSRLTKREQAKIEAGDRWAEAGGEPEVGAACRLPPTIDGFRAWSAEQWYRIAGGGDERHLRQHRKREHCKPAHGPRGLVGYLQAELGKVNQKRLPTWLAPLTPREHAARAHDECRHRFLAMSSADQAIAIETGEFDHGVRDHLALDGRGPDELTDDEIAAVTAGAACSRNQPIGAGRWWGVWGNMRRGILDETLTPREYQQLRRLMRAQLRRRGARRTPYSWAWSHVMLFDRARRDWTLFYELLQFLAIVRGRARPRGSFASMERRAVSQLNLELAVAA